MEDNFAYPLSNPIYKKYMSSIKKLFILVLLLQIFGCEDLYKGEKENFQLTMHRHFFNHVDNVSFRIDIKNIVLQIKSCNDSLIIDNVSILKCGKQEDIVYKLSLNHTAFDNAKTDIMINDNTLPIGYFSEGNFTPNLSKGRYMIIVGMLCKDKAGKALQLSDFAYIIVKNKTFSVQYHRKPHCN